MHYLRHEHLNALRAVDDPMAAEAIDFILEHWGPRQDALIARLRARVKKLKVGNAVAATDVRSALRVLKDARER